MIQAAERSSTATPAPSAGNFEDVSRDPIAPTTCSQGTAVILLRSALGDVERRAQNIASVLWLMAHSAKIDEVAGEAMLSIEDMVRELRDVARGAQHIEIAP